MDFPYGTVQKVKRGDYNLECLIFWGMDVSQKVTTANWRNNIVEITVNVFLCESGTNGNILVS